MVLVVGRGGGGGDCYGFVSKLLCVYYFVCVCVCEGGGGGGLRGRLTFFFPTLTHRGGGGRVSCSSMYPPHGRSL